MTTSWSNPIWYGKYRIYYEHAHPFHAWAYSHDDYDGADDSRDIRFGSASTIEQCKREIDQIEAIAADEAREEAAAHGQFGVGA